MVALDIIKKIALADSRVAKEQILIDAWMSGERNFFIAAQLACNFDISFKLTSVPRIDDTEEDPEFVPTFSFNDFLRLTKKLRSPACTPEKAKALVREAVVLAATDEWNNLYRDVLRREWAVEARMINKILRKLSLSDATTLDYLIAGLDFHQYFLEHDPAKISKLRGRKMLDLIPGGFRCMLVLDRESRTALMYHPVINGTATTDFTDKFSGIFDSLPCSMAVDCVSGTMSVFHMIDCLPLNDYYKGRCDMPLSDRHLILTGVIGVVLTLCDPKFKVMQKLNVDLNTEVGRANLREYIDMTVDSATPMVGIKDPDSPYEVGKSKNKSWIKYSVGK